MRLDGERRRTLLISLSFFSALTPFTRCRAAKKAAKNK